MGLIFDTNALLALAEGDPAAVQQATRVHQIVIPVVVLGEYRFGIVRSRHRREYERWLEDLLAGARVLDITEPTTTAYAEIRAELKSSGKPIPSNDVWIAALCRQHALPVLTRDKHFDLVPELTRVTW